MKASAQMNKISEVVFGLSEKSAKLRSRVRAALVVGAYLILGIISMTIVVRFLFYRENPEKWFILAARLLKYFTLLWAVNLFALKKAAHYLNDIFEINKDDAAMDFIKSVVFSHGKGRIGSKNAGYDPVIGKNRTKLGIIYNEAKISISDGKIPEADQHSPLLLIGGPGAVKVGLDQLVVFEKFNGGHAIFHSNDKPWKVEKYERIREVGDQQYAIVNLRDQFISDITVKARTKDGIAIEAQDVKVIFSVLRKRTPDEKSAKDAASQLYDPEAIKSLVYNQTIITSETSETFGVAFPWGNAALLLVSEIEDLIKTSTLSEILANVGQKEIEAHEESEKSIKTIKTELTRLDKKAGATEAKYVSAPPSANFKPRSTITARFHESEFIKKAAQAGIQLHWIDIGTWKIPSEKIMEKHKVAWNLSQSNAGQKTKIEKAKNKKTQKAFVDLINDIIIKKYKTPSALTFGHKKNDDKEYYDDDYPDWGTVSQRLQQEKIEKNPEILANEILKSIRKELLAGNKDHLQQDASVKEAVDNALQHISSFISHFVGQNK